MDFSVSKKIETIVEMINEFVDRELIPLEPEFLVKDFRSMLPVLKEKQAMVKKMELWAPNFPVECGGMGLSLLEHGLVSEALGRSPLGHFVFWCQAPDAGNVEILHMFGTDEQKQRYLNPLVQGDIRSCFSMTEVDMPGSNPVMLETTAVKDGGDYVINGHKWYTSSADGSDFAIVMAVTNPEASPYLRASMILVPTNTPGFNLVRNIPVMGHEGNDYLSHAEILYQSCRVPQENLLGPEGQGFVIAQERLGPGRIHHCMRWLGICSRSFDLMCHRANYRVITPKGKTLGTQQTVQNWIAESKAEIDAARLMTLNAAWQIDQNGAAASREAISTIKFVVANTMNRVVDRALQLHGGLGMTDDTILAFFYRHERAARIYDGADEVHKMSLAKRILRSYEGRTIK
ncbi:acyl-CoA dehydrogenase (ACAD) / acyl-CoA oxidase-like protein [Desulforapulum autotrophicum HRM2]|uniref:Acyl-CoA dehydrogenase (ACAD) / acyl-CoA oxidase-like protein n=1 Tax=Desulforapulum autotrophicum (strain ATCC 43914 / DSM 3382 / VKM B-1955 / HRM2) TaxID=177437 RepID=C0QGE8_DESAH|nr:acyl-CoA dehydrogenase family protein [Desulforapulum autotrophicum]ACN13423.1 acyl-CoA dehydrogenase (ACAD) / acyl-CoA oxidase-like protein [Desulforapulum autotrophicum HRM2]